MNAEYEAVTPLVTVQAVTEATWDALGQDIAIRVTIGREDGPTINGWATLKIEAAQALQLALDQLLAEKPGEEWTRQ